MPVPRRLKRQAGRHALVDGIPFEMPVNSHDSPALMAGFTVDHARASALIPGCELGLIRLPRDRALLIVTVIEYRSTDIGKYVEYSIAFACHHKPAGAKVMGTVLSERLSMIGQYVWDLPVSSLISVKGGKGIWGMPKHQANLDFRLLPHEVSSQYDLDGRLCARITVARSGGLRIPMRNLGATNYCQFRGMLMKSRVSFSDRAEVAVGKRAHGQLLIGDHPRMDPLRALGISDSPSFVACMPHSHGVLDDHCESWFLTDRRAPDAARPPQGLESVVGLPSDDSWLPPPTAAGR